MKKYLVLEFSDARLFREFNTRKLKDYYLDYGYPEDRINQRYFTEPITVYQVANLIAVLMGERPSPSLRKTYFKRYEPALDIAKNSYIRVDEYKYLDQKFGVERYISESMQLKKSAKNSWGTLNYFSWEKIRKFLGQDEGLLEFFVSELSNYLNIEDCTKIPVKKIREILISDLSVYYNQDLNDLNDKGFNELIETKPFPDGLRNLFLTLNGDIKFNDSVYLQRKGFLKSLLLKKSDWTRFKGIERLIQLDISANVICLSGELIIPLEENELQKIRNGDCCATFLDGGSVKFKQLSIDLDQDMFERFRKVSEISTETKAYIEKNQN